MRSLIAKEELIELMGDVEIPGATQEQQKLAESLMYRAYLKGVTFGYGRCKNDVYEILNKEEKAA